MKLDPLIIKQYTVVTPNDGTASIKEALLRETFLVVMEGPGFLGLLTPHDIIQSPHRLVVDCLHEKPRVTPDQNIDQVFVMMKKTGNPVLPVFHKDRFIGVIRRSDIMDFLIEEQWKLEVEVDLNKEALFHLNKKLISEIKEREQAEKDNLELQKQVYQAEKMQALGTLASGIAHELNNILHTIMGKAELTRDSLPQGSDAHTNMADVLSAGRQLEKILKQLLKLSFKSEKITVPMDIVAVVDESLDLIRHAIPKNIDIRFSHPQNPIHVQGDPLQIHQVMINLCMNAAQAMNRSPGCIDIQIGEVDAEALHQICPDATPSLPHVKISVTDSGAGMPPEIMDRILEPFFTTKPSGKGLGMGLTIIQNIITTHGGSLSMNSTPGKGSTFSFVLPVLQNVDRDDAPQTLKEKSHGR